MEAALHQINSSKLPVPIKTTVHQLLSTLKEAKWDHTPDSCEIKEHSCILMWTFKTLAEKGQPRCPFTVIVTKKYISSRLNNRKGLEGLEAGRWIPSLSILFYSSTVGDPTVVPKSFLHCKLDRHAFVSGKKAAEFILDRFR